MERSKVPVRIALRYWRYRIELAIVNMRAKRKK